jgi:hypothetical protein
MDTLSLAVSTAVPLLARPAGRSRRHSSGSKVLLNIIYIREHFALYINYLHKKYSYSNGNFGLKLPEKLGRMATLFQ